MLFCFFDYLSDCVFLVVILNEICIEEKNICCLIVLVYLYMGGSFWKSVLFIEYLVNKNNNFYYKVEEKDGVNVWSSCLIW